MLSNKEQRLLEAIEPRAEQEGIEIVTLEIVGAKKSPTIRVYIDTENGVSFDELSAAQSWINDIMDEIDPFPGAYMLEVSSPGIDRPLRTVQHFQNAMGEDVSIKTISPIANRSNFNGILSDVNNSTITVSIEGESFEIPFEQIKKANVKGKISF